MKMITFAIPSYNSAEYIRRCVDSILPAGDGAEILIINDGSTDETGAIADEYARQYPFVKALHFENGGHGEAINRALKVAEGLFFKVVDSDDYLDGESLSRLMECLKTFVDEDTYPDVIVTDYVRIRIGTKYRRRMDYWSAFPREKIITFEDIRYIGCYQNLFIHSLIYRTAIVRESGMVLPKHSFYVDTIYSHIPIYFAKTIYYLREPLYQYIVGRPGQSVDRAFLVKNIGQMVPLCEIMVDFYLNNTRPLARKQRKLLLDDMSFVMTVFSALLVMDGSPEALKMRRDFWSRLYARDAKFARRMRNNLFSMITGMQTERLNPVIIHGFLTVNRFFIVCT